MSTCISLLLTLSLSLISLGLEFWAWQRKCIHNVLIVQRNGNRSQLTSGWSNLFIDLLTHFCVGDSMVCKAAARTQSQCTDNSIAFLLHFSMHLNQTMWRVNKRSRTQSERHTQMAEEQGKKKTKKKTVKKTEMKMETFVKDLLCGKIQWRLTFFYCVLHQNRSILCEADKKKRFCFSMRRGEHIWYSRFVRKWVFFLFLFLGFFFVIHLVYCDISISYCRKSIEWDSETHIFFHRKFILFFSLTMLFRFDMTSERQKSYFDWCNRLPIRIDLCELSFLCDRNDRFTRNCPIKFSLTGVWKLNERCA